MGGAGGSQTTEAQDGGGGGDGTGGGGGGVGMIHIKSNGGALDGIISPVPTTGPLVVQ
jgi:hypothetical protein